MDKSPASTSIGTTPDPPIKSGDSVTVGDTTYTFTRHRNGWIINEKIGRRFIPLGDIQKTETGLGYLPGASTRVCIEAEDVDALVVKIHADRF